jgi:hypothetical protein
MYSLSKHALCLGLQCNLLLLPKLYTIDNLDGSLFLDRDRVDILVQDSTIYAVCSI